MNERGQSYDATFWQRQSIVAKVLISAFVWVPLVGAFIGLLFSRFMPSPLGVKLGLIVGVLYGLAWALMIEMAIRKSDPNSAANQRIASSRLLRHTWLRATFMWMVGLMFWYCASVWGYPWLFNMSLGTPAEREFVIVGWSAGSGKSCSHPDIERPLFGDSPRSLCVSVSARPQMKAGARLLVKGPASALGLNVEKMYVFEKTQAAPPRSPQKTPRPTGLTLEQMSVQPQLTCDGASAIRKEVRVRHIAIEAFPRDTAAAKAATLEEFQAAHKKLQLAHADLSNGATFEAVWSKYSDPQTSGGNPDGDIGWFKRGELVPEFERVAFCLPQGEISPVFRTVFGFHVLQVTGVRY